MQQLGMYHSFHHDGASWAHGILDGSSAFAVGFVSNMYGRFFDGNAFVVMVGSPRIEAKANSE